MQIRYITRKLIRLALLLALLLPSAAAAIRAPRVAVFELELRNVRSPYFGNGGGLASACED